MDGEPYGIPMKEETREFDFARGRGAVSASFRSGEVKLPVEGLGVLERKTGRSQSAMANGLLGIDFARLGSVVVFATKWSSISLSLLWTAKRPCLFGLTLTSSQLIF